MTQPIKINFSNVNISLDQFQAISSGKHNAGEVKLTSEHTIDKVNNFVTRRSKNNVSISHEEVIAIKNAFVKALKSNGVDGDELNKIREELGLAPSKPVDTNLHERSIKPLSRQQIREILDRNAAAINSHAGAGTIRTSDEIYARVGANTLASRRADRDAANAELDTRRNITENKTINTIQSVLAGDVDFYDGDTRKEMLQTAKTCLDSVLVFCKGQPRDNVKSNITLNSADGNKLALPTGLSEKALVRKLEDVIVKLQSGNTSTREDRETRTAFNSLATDQERIAFVANLQNDPDGAMKARMLAVTILYDRSVTDHETLSLANKLKDEDALGFAANLVSSSLNLRGDDLRNSAAVATARSRVDPAFRIDSLQKAFVPTLTNEEFNEAVSSNFTYDEAKLLPDFKMLALNVRDAMRDRFGEKGVPNDTTITKLAASRDVTRIFSSLPDRATPESIRDAYTAAAASESACRFAIASVKERIERYGGMKDDATFVTTTLLTRQPQFLELLQAAQSPNEAEAIVARFEKEIAAAVRRHVQCKAEREAASVLASELIAQRLGIPAEHFATHGAIDLKGLDAMAKTLRDDICEGKNPASTPEEIAKAFRDLVDKFVAERTGALATIDTLDISDTAKDQMKTDILTMDKIGYLDLPALTAAAKNVGTFGFEERHAAHAPKEELYQSLGEVNRRFNEIVEAQFAAMVMAGKGVGPDEKSNVREFLITAWFGAHPEAAKLVMEFVSRQEVLNDDYMNDANLAFNAQPFIQRLPQEGANAALVASLGKSALPPLHAQALVQAVRDEGFEGFTAEEALALFAPGGAAHGVLKSTMELTFGDITPSTLRIMARGALHSCKAAVQQARQDEQAMPSVAQSFLTGAGAQRALAAGYHASELPALAKAFALYKVAANATDDDALAALLDPQSKASRLVKYGGRFTESVANFRAGLALLDKFAAWYANLAEDFANQKYDTFTKSNAASTFVYANAVRGYEMFVFEDLAITPSVNLAEQDPEKIFGVMHNDAINFFVRGNGAACTGTIMQLPPAKRQVVYAAFKALEQPASVIGRHASTSVSDNVSVLARILRHYDEVAQLKATGNLDRAHLNALLTPDLNLPPNASSRQVNDAFQDRYFPIYGKSSATLIQVSSLLHTTGCTLTELMNAMQGGEKPAPVKGLASSTMKIEEIDGTTKGGRSFMLGDLKRPSNPRYSTSGKTILAPKNNKFVVKIGNETIQCATGAEDANAHIADKIEAMCGNVHIEQANAVMRGLSQAAPSNLLPILPQYGIRNAIGTEHMPLTYTLSKNDETGAVTIHYSEPEGFPLKFHWETTIALDGASTSTPIEIVDTRLESGRAALPAYQTLAQQADVPNGPVSPDIVADGDAESVALFRNMTANAPDVPANASPADKLAHVAAKVNAYAAKSLAADIASLTARYLVKEENGVKTEQFDQIHGQLKTDIPRGMDITIQGYADVSYDAAVVYDRLAAFVSGKQDTTFANAPADVKRKVGVLASILNQYTSSTAQEAFRMAIKPANQQDGYQVAGHTGRGMTFALSKDENGDIQIHFTQNSTVQMVIFENLNGKPKLVQQDEQQSYADYSMDITIPADNLDQMASADWTAYDRNAINAIDDMDERYNAIPDQYKFTGTVSVATHFHLVAA